MAAVTFYFYFSVPMELGLSNNIKSYVLIFFFCLRDGLQKCRLCRLYKFNTYTSLISNLYYLP